MKQLSRLASAFLILAAMLCLSAGCSGSKVPAYKSIPGLDLEKNVTIKIAIPTETDKALNQLANDFMKRYPNVNVLLQYVESYSKNAISLLNENAVDIVLLRDASYSETKDADGAVTATSDDVFYNFYNDPDIDFSMTNPLLMGNYTHTRTDTDGNERTYQYSVPLGGETRGVFVNKTLLNTLGLAIPTNYPEFLDCCQKLQEAGYIPVQGNPSTAAYALGLPEAARSAVNDPAAYEKLKNAEEGVSEAFLGTMDKLYELTTRFFYDYKTIEEQGFFITSGDKGAAMSFLGLSADEAATVSKPKNNFGTVAFFPYINSAEPVIRSLISDYALDTDVEFILTPLNDEGTNSAAYVTIYLGLCANKNSENLVWLREFVNFAFHAENNKKYAAEAGVMPNTTDAITLLADQFRVDESDCILCGSIRFSDSYNAYNPLGNGLISISKCNAEKYMVKLNRDASGNLVYEKDADGREYLPLANDKAGTEKETKIYRAYIGQEPAERPGLAFCTKEYYMDILEANFTKYRQ